MKTLLAALLLVTFGCDPKPELPEPKVAPSAAVSGAAQAATEDCDDKAKQKVEIKEETISLSNPSTGCTLDEAH
jgi:hypothetical protein